MSDTDPNADDLKIDWSIATWEGARREQLRRWADLPLERAIMAAEEMDEIAKNLLDVPSGVSVAREPKEAFRFGTISGDQRLRINSLRPVPLKGLQINSLGNYLVALGALRVVSTAAPRAGVRGCWKNGHFWLWSNETDFCEELVCELISQWKPEPFKRWWSKAQEASKKDDHSVPKARASETDGRVDQLDAVMVQADRRVFNDMFGTGGNIGKRDLSKVHEKCCELLEKAAVSGKKSSRAGSGVSGENDQPLRAAWLRHALLGEEDVELPEIQGAGTWFVISNKTFNSGQKWFREGRLSPWSFLLAVEGALLLRGGVHRRLGALAKGKAVFPFLCRPLAPPTAQQLGHRKSEFWAPLWAKTATLSEVEALLRSGVAEIGGRPATAPHEFAVAALDSAVEAGVFAFVPFELCQTTSSQVFEALPRDPIPVGRQVKKTRPSRLLLPLIAKRWVDRLPFEPNGPKQRGRFVGVRGPVEAGMVRLATDPEDPERWCSLLLLIAGAQQRIDRNKELRKRCLPVPRLSPGWFASGWPEPTPELAVARAIASIQGRPISERSANEHIEPLLVNIFGVAILKGGEAVFPEARPTRAVWHDGNPTRRIIDLLRRRLLEAGEIDAAPLWGARPCGISEISLYLAGRPAFDDEVLAQWIPALTLIDWVDSGARLASGHVEHDMSVPPLYSLLRPLFDPTGIKINGRPLLSEGTAHSNRPHAVSLRTIVNLLLQGQIDEMISLARSRYLGSGWRIVDPPRSEMSADPERLAASLLVPVVSHEVAVRFEADWLIPSKERQ